MDTRSISRLYSVGSVPAGGSQTRVMDVGVRDETRTMLGPSSGG